METVVEAYLLLFLELYTVSKTNIDKHKSDAIASLFFLHKLKYISTD